MWASHFLGVCLQLPDIEFIQGEFIKGLQALARTDTLLGSLLFTRLFKAIYKV